MQKPKLQQRIKTRVVLTAAIFVLSGAFSSIVQAWAQAQITNHATVPVTVHVLYSGCETDSLYIPAATMEADAINPTVRTVPSGHYEEHHTHISEWWKSTARLGCLIEKIDVIFHGGGYVADAYMSSGTSFWQFGIYQRSANRFRVMSTQEIDSEKEEKVSEKEDAGKSPGFKIHNKSTIPLTIALDQIGCLYYDNLVKPGETFDKTTGAVWFTIKARVADPGKNLTTLSCAEPVVMALGMAVAAVVTVGGGDVAMAAAEGLSEAGAEATAAEIAAAEGASEAGAEATAAAEEASAKEAAVSSKRMKAGLEAFGQKAAMATLDAVMTAQLVANTSVSKAGQYAGPPWPFRCTHKPEYQITGGPDWNVCKGATAQSQWDSCVAKALTGNTPLKITQISGCQ